MTVSSTSTSKYGVIDRKATLRFFIDDKAVPHETSSGAVARIRLYDGALTATQIRALDREPGA
jgi:hypothetical protein